MKKEKQKKLKRRKRQGHQWKSKLIISRYQSPLRQPAGCGCAITEPEYGHPPGDVASQSGNNAELRNGGTGKTAWIFCRGGHIENPGQVMFALGVCGEIENPSIYPSTYRAKRRSWVT